MRVNRLNKIEELLREVENVSIDKLCETFQVSQNTIRRDINTLEKHGVIKKIYGGILLNKIPESSCMHENKTSKPKKTYRKVC